MRPERTARVVGRWARLYTRGLPAPVPARRREATPGGHRDQIAHERGGGIAERKIALAVASRMLRGLAADVAWRGRQARLARPVGRVAAGVALVLSLPLVAMAFSDEVVWSLADFVVAGVLL